MLETSLSGRLSWIIWARSWENVSYAICEPLPSFCGCAGRFESYLVSNPEDRFSRDEAHIGVRETFYGRQLLWSLNNLKRDPSEIQPTCSVNWVCKWATSRQNQQNDNAPNKDSDQPGHPPCLIRVFAVRMKKAWVLSYPLSGQRKLWSDWADAQADLRLCWAHSYFVGFVTRQLKCEIVKFVVTRTIIMPLRRSNY